MSSSTRSKKPESRGTTLAAALIAAAAVGADPAGAQGTRVASTPAETSMAPNAHIARYVNDSRLAGEGRLTWLGFHVYDARLYAAQDFDINNPYARPFVLELTYARKLEGKGIAEASRDEIERLGFGSEEQRKRWFKQMSALFPDVEKGSRIAGAFMPNAGARFYVDGRAVGSIDEPEFARAFFAIWLDPRTRAPRLREDLLKGASQSAGLANR